MKDQVTMALVGAGSRGLQAYPRHLVNSAHKVAITAVAEPRGEWREEAIRRFNIPREHAFSDWKELAEQPRLADGALVATQDQMHVEPACALMRKGYHVMLEKPMATTEEGCREIIVAREETGRMLAVCHSMRYSSYSRTIKKLLTENVIGDIACIQHVEPVGYWHMAHSYVRGNWRREETSSPILLAKSCHDLDILRYWIGKRCLRVSSFGALGHFNRASQPAGAAERCVDCPSAIEAGCPYSALKIYLRDRYGNPDWPNNVLSVDTSPEAIAEALRTGPYGRCVYACDNDVVDRQVVNLEFEDHISASFTMCGLTRMSDRETWIMGTHGQLRGRNGTIEHHDFRTDTTREVPFEVEGGLAATGHPGDSAIILNFVEAIAKDNPELLLTTPEVSLESHLMAFAAERSRKTHRVETL